MQSHAYFNHGDKLKPDKRRELYQEFLAYVAYFQPNVFVMENVLGLKTAASGDYFARVQAEARVPVIGHLEGLCHTYVDGAADPAKAVGIVVNAKLRRTGVCGSTETLLIDVACAATLLPKIAAALETAGCELRGDRRSCALLPHITPATQEDWATEYLAPILSVAVVDGLEGALAHIDRWSSNHTDAIITEDTAAAEAFLARVDSAIVLHNASTQFADGSEFGFGAEIGIATGRIHARGPVGAEQLTTFKYVVRGSGQTRP
jgi:glutamate-5-semialdehyde dehydrogenase